MKDSTKCKLLALYPRYDSVLGPYARRDGRFHVVLNNSRLSKGTKGKLKTISYPKAIMEVKLGRRLRKNEEVDHKDGNKTNNKSSNYQVISRRENRQKQFLEGNNSLWGRNKRAGGEIGRHSGLKIR